MQHSDNMNGVAVIIYMNTVNPKEIIISASPNLELIYPMTMVYLRMYLLQNTMEDLAMRDPRRDIFPYMISHFHTPSAYDKAPSMEVMHNRRWSRFENSVLQTFDPSHSS